MRVKVGLGQGRIESARKKGKPIPSDHAPLLLDIDLSPVPGNTALIRQDETLWSEELRLQLNQLDGELLALIARRQASTR